MVESYGYRGVLGTIEWFPVEEDWTGLGLDAGIGDYPVGPVFAGLSPSGIMHAAWTESLLTFDFEAAPVTLVERRRFASSAFVLDRALTSALALPSTGPEVAANQWIGDDDLGLIGDANLWAGTIVRGREQGRAGRLDLRATRSRRAAGATCCSAGRVGCAGSACRSGVTTKRDDRGRGRRRLGAAQRARRRVSPAAA